MASRNGSVGELSGWPLPTLEFDNGIDQQAIAMNPAAPDSLNQLLLQQLRGLQRAGVTHLPPGTPREFSEPPLKETCMTQNLQAPPADRNQALAVLKEQVAGCTCCQELAETRTQTVFGVGNPGARVLFIGEAPGADEDRQGEPFVGRGGKLLNQIIEASKLKREDVYICNILKCRPPENRNPAPEEADACRGFLDAQLAIVDPDYIVCWGAIAAQNLLRTTTPIGKLRGCFHEHGRAKVLCTYHPAYLLRNPPMKKETWKDMQMLMAELGLSPDE